MSKLTKGHKIGLWFCMCLMMLLGFIACYATILVAGPEKAIPYILVISVMIILGAGLGALSIILHPPKPHRK